MAAICCLPMRDPVPGWSGDNVLFMLWEQLGFYCVASPFYSWAAVFWKDSWKNLFISSTLYVLFWAHAVTVVAMAIGEFPFPLHILAQALGVVPVFQPLIYIMLDPETKSTPNFILTFAKFNVLFVLLNLYFTICAVYLVLTSMTKNDPNAQVVVLLVYNFLSFSTKMACVALTPRLVPAYQLDPTRDTVTEVKLNMFYYFELCNELFVMLSFVNVADFKTACLVLILEFIPLVMRGVKMTTKYYRFAKEYRPSLVHKLNLHDFRLHQARLLVVQFFAEFNSMVAFFVLGTIMRFGPNAHYFPLRQRCDEDVFTVVRYVVFNLACYTLGGVVYYRVMKARFGVDLLAFAAEHSRVFFVTMMSGALSCYCFPVYLLEFHGYSLSWMDPGAYTQAEGCSS